MKTKSFLLALLILTLSILACRYSLLPGQFASSGDVLFQDTFENPYSGWPVDVDFENKNITAPQDGFYRIMVAEPQSDAWATPGLAFEDARIEVDVLKQAGPEANKIGLICRYKDDQDFYFFVFSSDGFYAMGKMIAGQVLSLGSAVMERSDAIQPGNTLNHLRADCVGDTLTFYINGQKVAEAADPDYSDGDAGILAGTFDEPGTDVLFDNFVVYKP